jgi:formylglycine-generating enzyme required for sulfatase activity
MQFVRIPAGEFMAGSPVSEKERSTNETPHQVRITKPFWLGATHVTVGQFAFFANESGYRTLAETQGWTYGAWNEPGKKWNQLAGGSWRNPGFPQGIDHPVVCVNWHDATAFCNWLSAKEGQKYRLPTEAEWEYACRAGKSTAYPWSNNPDDGQGWANCSDQTAAGRFTLFPAFSWSDGYVYTSPVTAFQPNAWGLHDMIGNALQWCGDWFAEYPSGPVENPQGPPDGRERVLRGGSFIYGPRHCRCAFRGRNLPDFQNFYVGFRVLLENEPQ